MSALITICLIGLANIFGELYTITSLISRLQSSANSNSELTTDIKSLRYTAEDMYLELEKIRNGHYSDDDYVHYILQMAKEKIEEIKLKYP